jgi:hypothetical protein
MFSLERNAKVVAPIKFKWSTPWRDGRVRGSEPDTASHLCIYKNCHIGLRWCLSLCSAAITEHLRFGSYKE